MKKIFLLILLHYASSAFSQTTHSVLVRTNQGEECPVINTLEDSELIQVFPNPASTSFHIKSKLGSATVNLVDMQGKIVRSMFMNDGQLAVDVIGLRSGVYILTVVNESVSQHIKIHIQ